MDVDFTKIQINEGDVLVLRGDTSGRTVDSLRKFIEHLGLQEVGLIALDKGLSLDVLNEEDMRKIGWVRATN